MEILALTLENYNQQQQQQQQQQQIQMQVQGAPTALPLSAVMSQPLVVTARPVATAQGMAMPAPSSSTIPLLSRAGFFVYFSRRKHFLQTAMTMKL